MFKTTQEYLNYYAGLGVCVEVVYRPHERMSWGRNRKYYKKDEFDLPYNHRSILNDELVFDFDDEKEEVNKMNAKEVMDNFDELGIHYTAWNTGGKGIHIHTLWRDLAQVSRLSMMKKHMLKVFAGNRKVDYQLAGLHLVRAEWGYYEKTYPKERFKTLIVDKDGLELNNIPTFLFKEYREEIKKDLVKDLKKLGGEETDNTKFKLLIDGEVKVEDGRERVLFYLIHQLKKTNGFDDVVSKLVSWYQYNGGHKLTRNMIKQKVRYHWNRTYTFRDDYLDDFIK